MCPISKQLNTTNQFVKREEIYDPAKRNIDFYKTGSFCKKG